MKIIFFSTYFYPYISGLTTYPYKILNYLADNNNQIKVLTFPHQKNPQKLKIKHLKFKIIYLPYLFRVSKGFISPQSLIYFLKETKSSELIILNIPNFEGFPLAILGKLLGRKIISVFHCEVSLGDDWKSKLINFFLNLSIYLQLFLSDIIVAYTKDYLESILVGKWFRKKIRFTLPPIEKLPVGRKKLRQLSKLKGENIWLGYAGRIAREKGLEYLIEAVENLKLKSKNGDLQKICLVFAGPYGKDVAGENAYYQKIKMLLDKKQITYRFFGNLSDSSLGAFYKSIDLLILPSVNKTEAFGMVQPEAMILGTPVVATNLPGIRIPIRLTKMGILVEPKNEKQLKEAILEVIKSKNKYTNKKLVRNAGEIFDINKVYKFWEDLINEKN